MTPDLPVLRHDRLFPGTLFHRRLLHDISGVTVVLPWCYSGVTVVLPLCYSGVTVVYSGNGQVSSWTAGFCMTRDSQEMSCYRGVAMVLQWCYSGVTVVSQICYSGVAMVLQ
jgi:hypothetical protein